MDDCERGPLYTWSWTVLTAPFAATDATPRNSLNDAIQALNGSGRVEGKEEREKKEGEQKVGIFIRKIDSLVTSDRRCV